MGDGLCIMLPGFDLVSVLILLGILQTVTLSFIFLSRGWRTVPWVVGCILFTIGVVETESFLNYSGFIIHASWFINLSPPLIMLLGPLNLVLAYQIYSPERLTKSMLSHFVPAVLFLLYSFFFYLQPADFKINAVMMSMHPEFVTKILLPLFHIDPLHIRGLVIVEGLALHLMAYSALTFLFVHRQEKRKAGLGVHINYRRWIMFSTSSIFVGSVVFLMTGGVVNGFVLFHPPLPGFATDLFCLFFAYGSTVFWIVQAQPSNVLKYSKSGLDDDFRKSKLATVLQIMETEKPFKNPNFSLAKLAGLVGITPHQASQVINYGKGMSFTGLVQHYRVCEAMDLLKSPDMETMKVENLAYELGYRSKSAFFTSFKKHTNTTPAEFRKDPGSSRRDSTQNP